MIFAVRLGINVVYQIFEGSLISIVFASVYCAVSALFICYCTLFTIRCLLPFRTCLRRGLLCQGELCLALTAVIVGLVPCLSMEFTVHDVIWICVMCAFTFLGIVISLRGDCLKQ